MNPRILILTLGTFAIGTEGFVIAGVLPALSHDLGVSIAVGGLLVTVFSLVYALGAPILASLSGHWPRRPLLLSALAVFTLANILAALAPTFELLMVARVLAALGATLYAPAAAAAAVALSTPEKRGQALSLISGGMTVALVVGVPLGTWVGNASSWRMTFGLVSILSGIALMGGMLLLPAIPASPAAGLRTRLRLLGQPLILLGLCFSLLWIGGAFTIYPYLSSMLAQLTHLSYGEISLALLIFGVASVIGNLVGGYIADRWGARRAIPISLGILILVLALLPALTTSFIGAIGALIVWGIAAWSISAPQQHRLILFAAQDATVVLALHGSAMYLGQAIGALIGGQLADSPLIWALGPSGATLELLALVVTLALTRSTWGSAPAPMMAEPVAHIEV